MPLLVFAWRSSVGRNSVRTTFATMTLVLVALYAFDSRSVESSSASTSQAAPKPLLLEKNAGSGGFGESLRPGPSS